MKKKYIGIISGSQWRVACVIFGVFGILNIFAAPNGPGWITQSIKQTDDPLSQMFGVTKNYASRFEPPQNGPITQSFTSGQAHLITPEIQALADGLLRDPLRIFNWVRKNIRYSPYFGSKKGAQLTLLERVGNDLDTCSLLVSLLHAAGYDASYQWGWCPVPKSGGAGTALASWLAVDPGYESICFKAGGYPTNYLATYSDGQNPETIYMATIRSWVVAKIGGVDRFLDPVFKTTQAGANIDWASVIGFNKAAFLSDSNPTNYLNGLVVRLRKWMITNQPIAYSWEVLGDYRISIADATTITDLNQTFPHGRFINLPIQTWSSIPDELHSTLRIECGTNDYTFQIPELQGQRLKVSFETNNFFKLWLEDTLITSGTASLTDGMFPLKVSVAHPHSNGLRDQQDTLKCRPNSIQTIIYAFDAGIELLKHRNEKLDSYRRQGLSTNSPEIVSETLNVLGLSWLRETSLFDDIVNNLSHEKEVRHHRIGRASQEANTFVDVGLQIFVSSDRDAQAYPDVDPSTLAATFVSSALEHGIFRQLQGPSEEAASTINVLAQAPSTYLVTRGTWGSIRPQLSGYSLSQLTSLDAKMSGSSTPEQGVVTFLPQSGQVPIQQWTGAGYAVYEYSTSSVQVTMAISGGLNGGFRSSPGNPNPTYPLSTYESGTMANSTPAVAPRVTGADPIDLGSGQFTLDATDLVLGSGMLPRGLTLSRHYHGSQRNHNVCSLGLGWRHNLDIRIIERSETEAALGKGTPEQMIPAVVAAWVLREIAKSARNADMTEWLRMRQTAQWFEESLRQNAVSIVLGERTLQFLKLPDGTYLSPPGLPHTLTKDAQGNFVLSERHGNLYRFDNQNRLSEVEDLWGLKGTLIYNPNGSLAQVVDCYNRSFTFQYSNGNLERVSDSTGRSVTYNINPQRNLVAASDPEGKSDYFEYGNLNHFIRHSDHDNHIIVENTVFDLSDRVTVQRSQGLSNRTWRLYFSPGCTIEENPKTNRTTHLFDDENRPSGRIDALNRRWEIFYDGQHHLTRSRSPLGNETSQIFDAYHNPLLGKDAEGFTNSYLYNSVFDPIQKKDKRSNATIFTFNDKHQPLTISNAAGELITYTYTPSGEPLTINYPGNLTTTYEYDGFGNPRRVNYSDSTFTLTTFNDRGDRTSFTDENNRTTTFTYNARREPLTTTFPDQSSVSQTYDNARNVSSRIDELFRKTAYFFSPTRKLLTTVLPDNDTITNNWDERDWLAEVIDPLKLKTISIFNALGQETRRFDPLGRQSIFQFDADGRSQMNVDPQGLGNFRILNKRGEITANYDGSLTNNGQTFATVAVTRFELDPAGNQSARINRRGKQWEFAQDAINRPLTTRTPLGRTNMQSWSNRGLLETITEPSGQLTAFKYDARGRLTNQIGPDYNLAFKLDPVGNVIQQSETQTNSLTKTVSQRVDLRNRFASYTNSFSEVIGYRWDAAAQLTNLIYPDGLTVRYTFDLRGRPATITDWNNRVTTLDWDAGGRLIRLTRPNGTYRLLVHDDAGQLIRLEEHLPGGRLITLQQFVYDLSGQITNKFSVPLPKPFNEPAVNATYDSDDQLLTFGGNSVSHDLDGNLTSGPLQNSSVQTNITGIFTWGSRNWLNSVGFSIGGQTDFGYSPDGHLETITRNGEVERLIVDPHSGPRTQVLERVLPNGDRVRYVYALGVGLLYEERSDGSLRFYHYDQVGSTVAMTDEQGKVTARAEYSPYGAITYWQGETVAPNTPFLYNGRVGVYTDNSTGLLQMRTRFYSPQLRRFINTDPSGFAGGPNFYAYANGNPILYNDPFGLGAQLGNDTSPWQLGFQWLTGTGPREQNFTDGDPMTMMLQGHNHIQDTRNLIAYNIATGGPLQGRDDYSLSGLQGVPKFVGDYSTLLTGGLTGNLAVTYIGSYRLNYDVTSINSLNGTATVNFHVANSSTISSATHPPVIGYTAWWDQNIGTPLNNLVQTGPLSSTRQNFNWTESITWPR